MFITDETLRLLNQNNPTLRKLNDEVLLRREKQSVHLVVSVDIEESMVKEAPVKIKGCSGLQDQIKMNVERFLHPGAREQLMLI